MERALITAIYPDRDHAERAAVRLRERGYGGSSVRLARPDTDSSAARAEQRAGSEQYVEERGLLTNKVLWLGVTFGAIAGIMLGAIVGALTIVATVEAPLSDGGFMIASLIAGFAAGSVAGGLIGAFDTFGKQRAIRDAQMMTDVVVEVSLASVEEMDHAQSILEETGPRHIERSLPYNTRRAAG